MNAQIEGRVAVVTGSSSGIGFETLRLLLGEGAKVAFCGRNPDRLAAAADEITDFGAPQSEFTVRIAQLSASVGAGAAMTATVRP